MRAGTAFILNIFIMEITEKKDRNALILTISGSLDSHTSIKFENTLIPKIDGGELFVVIDGTDLNYISSAGLRVILKAVQKLSPKKGKMALSNLKSNVQEVFEIAGFMGIVSLVPTQEQAVRLFNK